MPPFAAPAVELARSPAGDLQLCYRLPAAACLRLPAAQPPGPADDLWQHTCCELFVAAAGADDYREFNFSPSGQWAAYRFAAYRQRVAAAPPALPPHLDFRCAASACTLRATVPAALLPAGALDLGLCVVVEAAAGGKSYWALAHAAPQPDFHLRASFALRLPPP